ncbi:uncharacterized protein B0H18DRAFT_1001439 [Fomitopsis serialis]|uniref:uncharacterized protein n=1 Tax=Fomitopsis serialis TaxID=139415 RepID=UPI0020074EA0|nr:uncharacterized protein B0H18DRAFT_1001439 [Neoantrodia serialis]KAH9928109.1 hypothetical protein B0H18DRAFT_1001439 [Neoantrodia serialis]
MAPITDHYTPVGHPFYQYLVAPLPAYELGLSFVPVPRSESSSDWETDSVLRSFTAIARRMYTAEETIAAIKASRSSSPESKKCCNVGDNPPISSTSSSSSRSDGAEANGSIGQTATSTPPFIGTPSSSVENSPSTMDNNGHHHHPHRVDKDVEMFNADANAEAESETTPQMQQPRGRNGLRREVGNPRVKRIAPQSAPPASTAESAHSPHCGKNLYTNVDVNVPQLSSSLVVPIGPLAAAAENGMSAVEEAAQGSGPGRRASLQRCPSGLSQKITVPVQGVDMVQLKEVQCNAEVTHVSQGVGTEGKLGSCLIK